jgi:glycosyltransferase 2 family protein
LLIGANVLSIACLVWALHDAEIGRLGQEIRELDWRWVLLGVAADILVYVCQGWRWSILLRPLAPVSLGQSVRAIYVGLFANEILPLRSGEVIRCYLQSRWAKLPFPVILSSALMERVFDGIWLITFFLIALKFTPLPGWALKFAYALALIVLLLAGFIGVILLFRKQSEAWLLKPPGRAWKVKIYEIIEDVHAMGNSPTFGKAFLASLPYLALQVVPIYALLHASYALLHAYGFEGPLLGPAAVVMLVLRLGTVVPSAPGNLGTFQLLAAQGLSLFLDDSAMAKRFSFLLWSLITLPLLLGGFVAVTLTGLRIRQVQLEAQESTRSDSVRG